MKASRQRLVVGLLAVVALVSFTARPSPAAMPDPGPGAEGGMDRCCSLPGSDPVAPSAPTEAIAFGDFNGDGYDDVALGMPRYEVDGVRGAGAVRLLYGSSTGLVEDHPSVPLELWHQNMLHTERAEAGDRFGASLVTVDANGDGYADLMIGAPGEDTSAGEDSGQVHILHGSPSGLGFDVAGHVALVPTQVTGPSSFGAAVAAGDFDGDGFSDLVVGGPGAVGGTGRVWVYGGTYGSAPQVLEPAPVVGRLFASDSRAFGSALAVGDFNRDGYDDLAVGAPEEWVPGLHWECGLITCVLYDDLTAGGAVRVYHGSSAGLAFTHYLNQDERDFHVGTGLKGRLEHGDRFGAVLAAGDFDGDGRDDLAIGVPDEDIKVPTGICINGHCGVADEPDAGAVNVVFGSDSGLTSAGNQVWHQYDGDNHADVPESAEARDHFGATLAVGNFDGDVHPGTGKPLDDLAIGVPYEDVLDAPDAGVVHVLRGSYDRAERLVAWPYGRVWYHLDVGDPIQSYDRFGSALGAGDVNGDGKADLAVAVPVDSGIGTSTSGDTTEPDGVASVVHLLHGTWHPHGPGSERWQSWYEATATLEAGD